MRYAILMSCIFLIGPAFAEQHIVLPGVPGPGNLGAGAVELAQETDATELCTLLCANEPDVQVCMAECLGFKPSQPPSGPCQGLTGVAAALCLDAQGMQADLLSDPGVTPYTSSPLTDFALPQVFLPGQITQ